MQVLCGTKPFSDKFKAKKYKLQDQYLSKKDFVYIMKNVRFFEWIFKPN